MQVVPPRSTRTATLFPHTTLCRSPSAPGRREPPMADLVMPKLGLTMTEGLLAEWRVAAGDVYAAGDVLYVVETEKIANEIEATAPGRIPAITGAEGETVPVGTQAGKASCRERGFKDVEIPG